MSFRKRNVGLSASSSLHALSSDAKTSLHASITKPGIRPSPLDGRPTTSTGTQTLDDLLAGHAGLVSGNALMIEENGTTDYAGVLLRYYAAEGVVQGHQVHVVGIGAQRGLDLPGIADGDETFERTRKDRAVTEEGTMKIAWRYERLGDFGVGATRSRGGNAPVV